MSISEDIINKQMLENLAMFNVFKKLFSILVAEKLVCS